MHAPHHPMIPADILLAAYRAGIFPMADARDDTDVFWVEPRNRAVIPLDGFHCSKSLRKTVMRGRYRVTIDRAFAEVIEHCAAPRGSHDGSWISHRIQASYIALHDAGHAHSLECWDRTENGDRLVGGLYGVAFDRVFCGESMFSRADNASKVALAWLVALMRRGGYALLDCQFLTDHLASLGAFEIKQADYLVLLAEAQGKPAQRLPEAYSSLLEEAEASPASSPGKLIAQSLTHTS